MKTFVEFIKEGKVVKQSSDSAEARSLFLQAQQRLKDLLSLPLHDENASFRFESAYEVLREALQSFLALAGFKPYSHEAIFAFVREEKLISEGEFQRIDRYREMRNDLNYRGKPLVVEEAQEVMSFVKQMLPRLKKEFEKRGG